MKWLALLLLLVNLVVWYLPRQENVTSAPGQHQLPRVASIKPGDKAGGHDAQCLKIAWFDEKADAVDIAKALGWPYQLQTLDRTLPPLNWVLVPPRPHAEASAMIDELHNRGVEAWLVREGEYRNAISLGLFESESSATAFMAEKKRENLDVVLAKFTRYRIGYALVFEVGPEPNYSKVQAVEAEFGKKFEITELVACKGVATSNKSP